MFIREISVLGTTYTVKCGTKKEIGLHDENEGECRVYAKEILVYMDKSDELTEQERELKTSEIFAHEFLHAYFNEAGVELLPEVEESLCCFYMKNWRKLNNDILVCLDGLGIE